MSFKDIVDVLKSAATDFGQDNGTNMAAAVSYYTVFSLPPLLILIIMLASIVLEPARIQEMMQGQFAEMLGPDAGTQISEILQSADRPGSGGAVATILGIAALLFGAGGAFIALQGALNRAWEVAPDPEAGGIKNFVLKRLFSFGMVLGIAFLLLVSLAISAGLHAFGDVIGGFLPGGAEAVLAKVVNLLISLVVISLLFAAIFKVMPDATISWKDVRVGALATGFLFVIGKFLIGVYLGQSDPGNAFGAAGSLAVLLVWIYYSSIILIFGAEFTQAWATRFGQGIHPEPGAVRVVERTEPVRPAAPETGKKPG